MSGNQLFGLLVGMLMAAPAFAEPGEVSEARDVVERDAPPQPVITPIQPQPLDTSDLPIPTLEIERIPARTSYEFAMQVSFGPVAYFRDVSSNAPGFGVRGAWGKNVGARHRIGFAGVATIEGEPGVHTLLTLEPGVAWDFVGKQGLALGLTGGPSFIHTRNNATVIRTTGFAADPYVAARVGWSQTFSSVGRRLFVYLEPKVRFTDTGMVPIASFVVGSGGGR
ncbi:MAG: hypothetical protein AAF602_18130 [Myxococcota bacterium]